MIRITVTGLLTAGFLPLLAAMTALGQQDEEGAFDRTPQNCVMVSRIDQTKAVDDQNIIFRMRGDQVYRNTLPKKCPGLARENRIGYQTTTSRLCNIDTITVLEEYGIGFRPGWTCRLGPFVPLSPAEVEDLEAIADGEAGQDAIETSSVELEGDEVAAEGAEDEAADAAPPAGDAED